MLRRAFTTLTASAAVVVVAGGAACGAAASRPAADVVVVPPQPPQVASASPAARALPGPPAPEPAIPKLDAPACAIKDAAGAIHYAFVLRYEGQTFAAVGGDVRDVDVRLAAGPLGGTATLTHDGYTLTGEVLARDVAVLPRSGERLDGWLEIRGAVILSVGDDGALATRFSLPHGVVPKSMPDFAPACADVTSLAPARPEAPGTRATLKGGRPLVLRAAPGGREVASLVFADDAEVRVVDKRGASILVRAFDDDEATYAWGWLDAPVMGGPPALVVTLSPLVVTPPDHRTCDHDVALYVHGSQVDAAPVRVGTAKAGATLQIAGPPRDGEVPLDLVLLPDTGWVRYTPPQGQLRTPFAREPALAGCKPAAAPPP